MSYEIYKLLHLLGLMLVFIGLGALFGHAANVEDKKTNLWRKTSLITHGLGMLLLLLGGFGMLARLQIHWPWPGWIIGKLVIWLILGAAVALVYRFRDSLRSVWVGLLAVGLTAAYLALNKPF